MKKQAVHGFLFRLAIIVSVLSQFGAFESIFRIAMYIIWISIVIVGVINLKFKIELSNFAFTYMLLYIVWLSICMAASMFGGKHLHGNYLQIMLVPVLVTITANLYRDDITQDMVLSLCKTYVACALCFALWVHITYFPSYANWLQMESYSYTQKNSAAQIWCSSIIIIMFVIKPKIKSERFLWYGIAIYLLMISALSQCRTALLGIGFAGFIYVIKYTKHRFIVISIILLACLFMWNNQITRQFINQTFLLEKYAGADINTMSSYRIDYWQQALEAFSKSPLLGVGEWYVDCSYISVLAEGGIIGFVLIESIWLKRIVIILKSKSTKMRFLVALVCFYLVESLLEGFPPFGPGVSSFMFWFLSESITCNENSKTVLTGHRNGLKSMDIKSRVGLLQ